MRNTTAPVAALTDMNGRQTPLPPLLRWDIQRSDGSCCDAFALHFRLTQELLPVLPNAVSVCLHCGDTTVFTGRVDEYELTMSDDGCEVLLVGRGMGALLQDNQLPANHFVTATMADILQTFVTPLGIRCRCDNIPALSNFSVDSGDSCLQALKGFCVHAGAPLPRFDAEGTLLIQAYRADFGTLGSERLLRAVYRDCRYGVISRQTMIHIKTGQHSSATYPAFLARGGKAQKVLFTSGSTVRDSSRSAQQHIDESRQEEFVLELTMPGNFLYEPGGILSVALPLFELERRFFIREVRSQGSESGIYCTLTLYR